MNVIRVEEQSYQRFALASILITAIVLVGTGAFSSVTLSEKTVILNSPAAEEIEPRAGAFLTASEALAAEEAALFVFTPADKCARQYCLNANVIQHRVAAELDRNVNIVDVPVYAFYIYADGTAPSPIYADWDLYPAEPYSDWLPQATMTEFGWGVEETHVLLVDEDGQMQHDFGVNFHMNTLSAYLAE